MRDRERERETDNSDKEHEKDISRLAQIGCFAHCVL